MKTERRIALPNSVLLVVSSKDPQIPQLLGEDLVAATSTCVAVGTLAEDDGKVDVVLTDEPMLELGHTAVYEGALESRHGYLAVVTILGKCVLSESRPTSRQALTIWANDAKEPSKIIVQLHS